VKLRDHPLMSYHGAHNWPPVWISLYDKDDQLRRSEVGVLAEVRASQFGLEDRIVLMMKHDEKMYGAALTFADATFCKQVLELMRNSVGLSIQDIGDLDLSFTL
jgi:hypothetical protein